MAEGKKKYWIAMNAFYLYADTAEEAKLNFLLMLSRGAYLMEQLIVVRDVGEFESLKND